MVHKTILHVRYQLCPDGAQYAVVSLAVCLSVCLSVSPLTVKPFDVWSQNLVQELTLMVNWTSSTVKFIGQGHQAKNVISRVF